MDNLDFLFAWMSTPNPNFGGSSPLDLLDRGRGETVAQFIREAMESEAAAKAMRGADNE